MKKYIKIFQVSALQYFVYRLSFVLWRVRNVLGLIFLYFLWTSFFAHQSVIFSYTAGELITYILLINILTAVVLGTRTADIANEILNGNIVNYLLRPFSFFKFTITKEITDKLINLIFSIGEIILLIIVFRPDIFIQTNPATYILFLMTTTIAVIISFFISLILSFLAFWSAEIWAPRFIYLVLISLIAGTFFPLDVLPSSLYNILLLTPFPYLVYFPTKIYIHGFSVTQIIPLVVSILWALILYKLTLRVWENGIKNYSAYGR